jgi:hypothetical protein
MSRRNEWEPPVELEETVRGLPALAQEAGELRWRESVNKSFQGVSDKLGKIDVRLARIEERQLSRTTVAEIAKKEVEVIANEVKTLSRIVWGMAGAAGSGILVLAIAKLFK